MTSENEVKSKQVTTSNHNLVYDVKLTPQITSTPAPAPTQSGTKSEMEEMAELLLRAQKLRILQEAMNPQPAAGAPPVIVQQQTTLQQQTPESRPAAAYEPKSITSYVLLALFFGFFGAHNFYAKRTGSGIAQLLMTLVSFPMIPLTLTGGLIPIVFVWVVIEMIAVKTDGNGVRMK